MRNVFSMLVVGGLAGLTALPALACGGGGCGMGGMGGGGGYYRGARSRASTKVLSGGPRVAQSSLPSGRGLAGAPRPSNTLAVRTVAEKKKAAAPLIYTCPMHPQVQWTKPTDCPICGMKLKLRRTKADAVAPADEHAGMEDEMDGMPGMDADEMGGMDEMMCCPGCMMNMGGMSKAGGKSKAPAAPRKARGGSMRGMAGMGCGC